MKVRWSHFTTMEMVVFISPVYVYCFAHLHFTKRCYVKFTFARLWVPKARSSYGRKSHVQLTSERPSNPWRTWGCGNVLIRHISEEKEELRRRGASCMFLLPHRWRICCLNPQPTHWQPVSAFKTKKTLKHGQKHFHLGISQGKKTLNIIISKQVDSLFQVFPLMEADSCLSGSMFTLRGWFQSSYKTQPKTKQHSNHATKRSKWSTLCCLRVKKKIWGEKNATARSAMQTSIWLMREKVIYQE